MVRRSYQQYAIVTGDTAQQLTERLNDKLIELRDKDPVVSFEGMIARIQYTERETVPDSLSDEYELQGVRLTCQDCPFFCPVLKADGSVDLRAKYGGCHLAEDRMARKDSRACEKLFHMLNDGRITLCVESE